MPDSHLDENGFVVLDDPDGIRAQEIANCGLCDGEGYRGGTVCLHQQHSSPEVRAAAIAAVRAALAKGGER